MNEFEEISSLLDEIEQEGADKKKLIEEAKAIKDKLEIQSYQKLFELFTQLRELKEIFEGLSTTVKEQQSSFGENINNVLDTLINIADQRPEIQKVAVQNQIDIPKYPEKMTIANVKDFPKPYEEVKVTRPKWIDELKSEEGAEIKKLLRDISNNGVFVNNRDPNKAISVRLSDGKKFYQAVFQALGGGGGASFENASGRAKRGLVDAQGHVQVDVLSGSTAGTEYDEGDTDASLTGSIAMAEGPADTVTPLQVDASKHLQVDIAADSVGIGGGTQYTEGNTDATITGTALMWEDAADTLVAASATKPLPVDLGANNDVTVTGTVDLGATDNAVLDAIQTATEATQASLEVGGVIELLLDDVEGLLTTIDGDTSTIAGDTTSIDGKITACNTGDVTIGAALPAGDNNIGNVDIVTAPTNGLAYPVISSYGTAVVNLAADTSNQSVVAAQGANTQIWVMGFVGTANTAGNITFQDEDDTSHSGSIPVAETGGFVLPIAPDIRFPWFKVATNKALEIDTYTCEFDGIITYIVVDLS